jgi:hypothetical protein
MTPTQPDEHAVLALPADATATVVSNADPEPTAASSIKLLTLPLLF